jgi:hypothetical protein
MDKFPATFGLICGGFFFLLTFVAGIVLTLISVNSKKKAGASQQWPNTPARISVSEVRQSTSTDDDGRTSSFYYPHIEYTYAVAGQTFTGKQIAFGGTQGYGTPGQASTLLAKYPANATVQVFYNPQKQSESVIERRAGGGAKATLVIGIILLIISMIIACPLLIGVIRNFM